MLGFCSNLPRLAAIVAMGVAGGCAGGQPSANQGEATAAQERADDRIEALEAELAEAEARVEALEARQPGDRADSDPGEPAARLFTREALTEQPRAALIRKGLPEEFEPGPTAWKEAPIPDEFSRERARGYDRVGALATAAAQHMASPLLGTDLWEVTTRVLVADDWKTASAAILTWGLQDDAVDGDDLLLELREGERGWYVESASQRSWCRRGISDDQRCR